MPEITEMLCWGRPHGSLVERRWLKTFVAPAAPSEDGFGNHSVIVGDHPRILWSAHVDTMCSHEGYQALARRGDILQLAKGKAGMCLGADDGAGCWLLLEMIEAQIPGLYIFHRGEERGGLGSAWIVKHKPLLTGIDFAIAFDRRGKGDVITHQAPGRCASDATARQIAGMLGGAYAPCDTGVFTDTANYAGLVAECLNISVGYEHEHGPTETLDMAHLAQLRDRVLAANWGALEAHREPGDFDDEDFEIQCGRQDVEYDEDMIDLVIDYPQETALLLRRCGISADDFSSYIARLR